MAVKTLVPRVETLNIVMAGSINPAIFHPDWFIRHQMISEDAATDVAVVSHDISEVRLGNVNLVSVADKLILSTTNIAYAEILQDLAKGILAKLPHTPLKACGINHEAVYSADSVEHWHRIGHTLAPKEIWESLGSQPGLRRLEIEFPISDGDFPGIQLVTVEPMPTRHSFHPALRFRSNTHFGIDQIQNRPEGLELNAPVLIDRFLTERWKDATTGARRVATKVFEKIPKS